MHVSQMTKDTENKIMSKYIFGIYNKKIQINKWFKIIWLTYVTCINTFVQISFMASLKNEQTKFTDTYEGIFFFPLSQS